MDKLEVKWYGTNALEFRHSNGSFMIDPYVSRSRELLTIPAQVDKYITSEPDFILMTHAHWDHLPDMTHILQKYDKVLYASPTACHIMRALGVPEKNLHEIFHGDKLSLPGNVRVEVFESLHKGHTRRAECYDSIPDAALLRTANNWLCGETLAFMISVDGKTILNIGTANLLEENMHDLTCDYLFCGISRFGEGFPELLSRNVRFRYLIPTHHDEFTLPLDQFSLRGDMSRLAAELPGLTSFEIPVLQWTALPE